MPELSKRERVDAALKGEAVDRVPVSAWRHFLADEYAAEPLARVTLKHYHNYDWDWIKINPRATYYAEAWGNRYDFSDYDSVVPRLLDGPLHSPADLEKITTINPTAGVFAEQLDLVRLVKAGIGDAHFLQTVFSPLSVLSFLISRPRFHKIEEFSRAQYDGLNEFLRENPEGAHEALKNIPRPSLYIRRRRWMRAQAACSSPSSSWRGRALSARRISRNLASRMTCKC